MPHRTDTPLTANETRLQSPEYAAAWLSYIRRPEQVFQALLVPALAEAFRSIKIDRALDVACGEGRLSRALLAMKPECLVACDFNAGLLAAAKKELSASAFPDTQVSFVEADVTLPFPGVWSGSFDAIGNSGLLHFLDDSEVVNVLANCRSALSKSGKCFSAVIHPQWAGSELRHWDESTPILVPFRGLQLKSYRRSPETYCRLHKQVGFSTVEPRALELTAEIAGERFERRIGSPFYLTIAAA